MTTTTKEFISGLYSSDVADTAPAWILGKGSIHLEKLMVWLDMHKHLADEKGFINFIVKRSQEKGKRYIEVDTWKPTKQTTEQVASEPVEYPDDNISPEDIPFN